MPTSRNSTPKSTLTVIHHAANFLDELGKHGVEKQLILNLCTTLLQPQLPVSETKPTYKLDEEEAGEVTFEVFPDEVIT